MVDLVQGLLNSGSGVVLNDIGVMATYRKQVRKVRLLLRERGLGAIRVSCLLVCDWEVQVGRRGCHLPTQVRNEGLWLIVNRRGQG